MGRRGSLGGTGFPNFSSLGSSFRLIIGKQLCYLTKGMALKCHLQCLSSHFKKETTNRLLFWPPRGYLSSLLFYSLGWMGVTWPDMVPRAFDQLAHGQVGLGVSESCELHLPGGASKTFQEAQLGLQGCLGSHQMKEAQVICC